MPRPRKGRRVCCMPENRRFGPLDADGRHEPVCMTVDEFEAVRLIDLENLTQEACAARMGVARTTVQAIYDSARTKLAQSLINGYELSVGGGDYVLCDGYACGCCHRGRCRNDMQRKEQIDENSDNV